MDKPTLLGSCNPSPTVQGSESPIDFTHTGLGPDAPVAGVSHQSQGRAVNTALLPVNHPNGDVGTGIVNRDYLIVSCTDPHYVGSHVSQVAGLDEALGADLRYVMETRVAVTVRRFWGSRVWQQTITPHTSGGVQVDYEVLYSVPSTLLNLKHFFECANLVLEALGAGEGPPASQQGVAGDRLFGAASPLRVVPRPA